MSKDIIVLAPNGRRQIIHCTADTSILQVLEDVCRKQGFQPSDYDLKHHNHTLDLTTTVRFSNLPNKATIEMVEAERKRLESNVTVGLLLEDGERRTADFSPHTSLLDIINSLASSELNGLQNPSILYMRQEVTGLPALKLKTLRMLGLIRGRAILRLLNKADEPMQANVSAVYRKPVCESPTLKDTKTSEQSDADNPGTSHKSFDPVSLIKIVKNPPKPEIQKTDEEEKTDETPKETKIPEIHEIREWKDEPREINVKEKSPVTEKNLERRLNIEQEVTFLGSQKAIAFMQPDDVQDDIEDLPNDFYELTIEEVRKLYHDMQQQRIQLENTPLTTSTKREELDRQTSEQKLNVYMNVVVRIQFPDGIILQGVFQPLNVIQDVINFVKEHLQNPAKPFHVFTTPLKADLDPKISLMEAKFVPCVHMHFKWLEENGDESYLKKEIYSKKTSSDAASILASKYRAPSRRKIEDTPGSSKNSNAIASTSKNSKMPKWFKN